MNKAGFEIVLTGGPCAGKTTGLAYLSEKLRDFGFRVLIIPEYSTLLISHGVSDISRLAKEDAAKHLAVEKQMLRIHLSLRRHFQELAEIFLNEKVVILCDRGAMDIKAYLPKEMFKALLQEEHLTLYDVRDSYEGVIFLVTAADGAPEFYSTENNPARQEDTLKQALQADSLTCQAWLGHSHLRIIDNSTDFSGKMKRTLAAASRLLGIPVPLETERKFLLKQMPTLNSHPCLAEAVKVEIEQIYLVDLEGKETRIRRRTQEGSSTYYLTEKQNIADGKRYETERFITPTEYVRLLKEQDPRTGVVQKERLCFSWKHQYFELDCFQSPRGLVLLEVELTEENDCLELPDFLAIDKEVTADSRFTNHEIALALPK
ncbi:AAA family ATPase [Candidatus Berkelbacteria bacterium]|nr:AAA family ATPase [Candidatus Berkelbacteria bacterium]MBI2588384.1 AAA family ATPase [Candidatus Berkelbacteria bacterium]MBI4029671.1 AAA family ATPase [Candidatus Berkelbacteria bacterium]